jgi:pilus assembly protein Flp/PilA
MHILTRWTQRLGSHDQGTTAMEYAIILAGIAIVIVVGVKLLGTNLSGVFTTASSGFGSG